jgi:hypothetical protein
MTISIWERVEDALTPLALPMAAGVWISESGQPQPDRYLVYSLVSSRPEQHADDLERNRTSRIQVSFYSRSSLAGMPDIATAMRLGGFTFGPARDLPYSTETKHFGYAMDFFYLDEESEEIEESF